MATGGLEQLTPGEEPFDSLLARIRACRVCAQHLPLGPRPVVQANPAARLLVVGQAPGRKVHRTGIPWNDPSGDRLRDWLGLDRTEFYNEELVALVPMGFCYPGTTASGDAPPRPECAPLWAPQLIPRLRDIRLTVLAGRYAHDWHLGRSPSVAATVARWRELGEVVPVPHPSPRNRAWFARHPWFEDELVPELRRRVSAVLAA